MFWIIYSSQSSQPGKRHYAKGNTPAAQRVCRQQKRRCLNNNWFERFGAASTGRAFQCLSVLLPLMVIGGTPASAFPNVGLNLYAAIQKQDSELNKQKELEGFKFGILGSIEFKTANHRFQLQWEGVLSRIKGEAALYERCSASVLDCPPKLRQWRELIQSLKGQPVKIQLARLNKSINRMAKYADDDKIYGKQDYWATPLEFLNGRADCEDYAVVKFWSLLELGFSNDQLRLAVVRDTRRKIIHAVVTVETGGKNYVLDSLFDHPVEQKYVLKYAPVYSANMNSQWAHIVTRKIRVSYLNHLENGARKRVIPAQAPIAPGAVKVMDIVDWS